MSPGVATGATALSSSGPTIETGRTARGPGVGEEGSAVVRAVGTLVVVGAGVVGFWIGYLLDLRRHSAESAPDGVAA